MNVETGASEKRPIDTIAEVDFRLIGLSPQYWSYTPLLIGDLIGLPLVNGVDCFASLATPAERLSLDPEIDKQCNEAHTNKTGEKDSGDDDTQLEQTSVPDQDRRDKQSWNVVPLSRVLIRGIATAIDPRPFGCTMIVIDDGTGSIDCRYWDDSQNGDSLSELTHFDAKNTRRCSRFAVGDSLEVMGKIKVLTAGTPNNQSNQATVSLDARFGCVREIHATSVCLVAEGHSNMANQWSGEVLHWLKCMDFAQKCKQSMIRCGKDFLPLLGDRIFSSILSGGIGDFSDLEKAKGSENNILKRKCCQTQTRIRSAFFYCHCEATWEALDSRFRYRDALLNRLLDMEAQLQCATDSCFPDATEDCMDLFGAQPDTMPPPLLFSFESIYKNEELAKLASNEVASSTIPTATAQRLVRRIFAALTNDGILSLFDSEKDLYLLVSRNRVIGPYLEMSLVRGEGVQIAPPFFIRCIPKKRIAEIMSSIDRCDHAV